MNGPLGWRDPWPLGDDDPPVLYAFDTGGVLALVDHAPRLARLLFDASAHQARVVVPMPCVFEAALALDAAGSPRARLLTLLRAPGLRVTRVAERDRPMLSAASTLVGDEGLAHASVAALNHVCRLVTTRSRDVWPLGLADWQIVAS
jgi:hypothetical protein